MDSVDLEFDPRNARFSMMLMQTDHRMCVGVGGLYTDPLGFSVFPGGQDAR